MTNDELEQVFSAQMPEEFQRRILGSVFSSYQISKEQCRIQFAPTEAVNVEPFYRRGVLEGHLRDAAGLSAQLTARIARAEGSNWNHTEIHGGQVVLTASAVSRAGALVRKSDYRIDLAQTNTPTLFSTVDMSEPLPLYAILIHSRSDWDTPEERAKFSHLPGSAYIAFPDESLEGYMHKFSLFEKYPDIVESHQPDDLSGAAKIRYIRRSRAGYWAA
jgi:hypothetical protein